jgi:hypothetical protein
MPQGPATSGKKKKKRETSIFCLLRRWQAPALRALLLLIARHARASDHALSPSLFSTFVRTPAGKDLHWIDAIEAPDADSDIDWLRALALGALALSIPAREVMFCDGRLMARLDARPPPDPKAVIDTIMLAWQSWSSMERAYRDHGLFVREVFWAHVMGTMDPAHFTS